MHKANFKSNFLTLTSKIQYKFTLIHCLEWRMYWVNIGQEQRNELLPTFWNSNLMMGAIQTILILHGGENSFNSVTYRGIICIGTWRIFHSRGIYVEPRPYGFEFEDYPNDPQQACLQCRTDFVFVSKLIFLIIFVLFV